MFIKKYEDDECEINYTCSICGAEENFALFLPDRTISNLMGRRKICMKCAFWLNIINRDIENKIIVNGHFYEYFPYVKRPYNRICNSNGKEFYISFFDKTLLKTNNLKYYGKIPQQFRQQLPDNAILLSMRSYMKIKKDPFQCEARGCWDRYNCWRYKRSCEGDKPFNIIPENHKIGDEKCPSFINIKEKAQ